MVAVGNLFDLKAELDIPMIDRQFIVQLFS